MICKLYFSEAQSIMTMFWNAITTFRSRWNKRYYLDDIIECIFLNESVLISVKFSLKFFPNGPINNIPSFVQIMAWRRSSHKPLSEPMMVRLLTRTCVTRPQWVTVSMNSIEFKWSCLIFTPWIIEPRRSQQMAAITVTTVKPVYNDLPKGYFSAFWS